MWDKLKGALGRGSRRTDKPAKEASADPALAAVERAIGEVIDPKRGIPIAKTGLLSDPSLSEGRLVLTLTVPSDEVATYQPVRDALEVTLSALPDVDQVFAVLATEGPAERIVPASSVKAAAGTMDTPSQTGATGSAEVSSPPPPPARVRMGGIDFSGIDAVIAVASGKGGVGKSTTTANLAVALARGGLTVGVLDADVYGPSMPRLFGISEPPVFNEAKKATPPTRHGVKVMSMGFLVDEGTPMVWRAPMVVSALKQMLSDVDWAPLDILLIDMPPGTGDTQLTISQQVPLDGAIIVSTPQDLALIDARKGVAMFQKVEVPILGILENMSTYICPSCGHQAHIFGHGGAQKDAARFGVPFLGEVPLNIDIRRTSDAGTPIASAAPDAPHAAVYATIASRVWDDVAARKEGRREPPAIIIEDELETV